MLGNLSINCKFLLVILLLCTPLYAEGKKFTLTARASEIDPRTREHPEIDYVFNRKGKPADTQLASVDTHVKASGYLVIWLMEPKQPLFDYVNSYGHHAIQVTYPREWFAKMDKLRKEGDENHFSGIRLEAATGEDHTQLIDIPKPDGLMA